MEPWKKKLKISKSLFTSASSKTLGSLPSGHPNPGPQLAQPSGEQQSQQTALSSPTPGPSRPLKRLWRPSSPGVECCDITMGHPITTPASLSTVHAAVPSQPTTGPNIIEPSSVVWTKALDIAKKKLSDNNLPPLDLTNLTSQSAEENMKDVVNALIMSQEDDMKKKWNYTWRGKKIIVVERLGKILKNVEKYTKVVDIAIQSNPQVSALVWAGIWAILRVCTLF